MEVEKFVKDINMKDWYDVKLDDMILMFNEMKSQGATHVDINIEVDGSHSVYDVSLGFFIEKK